MRGDDEAARLAAAMLAFRRIRPRELPNGLFDETGWEYMLELFIADARGERLTGRMVADRSRASYGSASRWLKHLSAEGLVIGDGNGELDDTLALSANGFEHMERLLTEASALKNELIGT